MKRNLLTQIKNEWRDNVWLIVLLVIVTGVMCVLSLNVYVTTKYYFSPRGFDYKNVYTLSPNYVQKDADSYIVPDETEDNPYKTDFLSILQRLRENPNVEEVAVHNNATPYNYSFNGTSVKRTDINDSVGYYGNVRTVSPELIKVLGYKSLTGKTPEQLEEMLRRGEMLISNSIFANDNKVDVNDYLGREVIFSGDSSKTYKVGDVIENVRRSDYEPPYYGTIVRPFAENKYWGAVVIRVKPDHAGRFKEDFRNNPDLRRQRNVYLTNLTALSDTRESCQRGQDNNNHVMICLMLFLLLTIFLGLMGTFRFRVQQRIGEIALRKVCGAKKSDIFRRVLGEGMILLLIATAIMSAILWSLSGIITDFFSCSRVELLVFEAISVGLVALCIVVSLWYPARKAMQIEPAIALKSE